MKLLVTCNHSTIFGNEISVFTIKHIAYSLGNYTISTCLSLKMCNNTTLTVNVGMTHDTYKINKHET